MDYGLIITTILAIINVVVLGVGGTWTVAKVKNIADMNTSDVREIKQEIKEGFRRLEEKMEVHRDVTRDHGEQLASLREQMRGAGGRH